MLFDFDGTLVDSEYLHHESWLAAAAPWGVTISWEDYERELVGISDRNACESLLRRAGLPLTPELIVAGRRRKHRAYRRRAVRELAVLPSVKEWIHRFHRDVPMGVVSSSSIPDVVPILERQGLADPMRFVICGDHVERLKPDPEPYLLALRKLQAGSGEIESRNCLVFEDSATGIRSAMAAGMSVHRLASQADLPAALQSWSARIPGTVATRRREALARAR